MAFKKWILRAVNPVSLVTVLGWCLLFPVINVRLLSEYYTACVHYVIRVYQGGLIINPAWSAYTFVILICRFVLLVVLMFQKVNETHRLVLKTDHSYAHREHCMPSPEYHL